MNLTKALTKANQLSEQKKGISLSGLLNIIDGKPPLPIITILYKTKYLTNPKG